MDLSANLQERFSERKIVLVTGHYGSGKTEFAINLALQAAQAGRRTALCDLDIVNPYFRSRERREILEKHGIRLIASSQECTDADVPALPADIFTTFEDPELFSVYDVGGDPVGARVLARFRPQIQNIAHELLFVVNANRPQTKTAALALEYLRNIEKTCGLAVTGIVGNTHLCGETSERELEKGRKLTNELAALANLPVVCHVVEKKLCQKAESDVFPIDIYMKKPWESV